MKIASKSYFLIRRFYKVTKLACYDSRTAYNCSYHVNPCEALSSIRSPMSQKASLEMVQSEWVAEKRVPPKIDHAQAHVQRSMEIIGHLPHLILAERMFGD
jgi:hypothetical protein